MHERPNDPTTQRTNEPTTQRTNEPTNQRTNEPTNQRTNEPTNVDGALVRGVHQPQSVRSPPRHYRTIPHVYVQAHTLIAHYQRNSFPYKSVLVPSVCTSTEQSVINKSSCRLTVDHSLPHASSRWLAAALQTDRRAAMHWPCHAPRVCSLCFAPTKRTRARTSNFLVSADRRCDEVW